jgi:hypothetical protein
MPRTAGTVRGFIYFPARKYFRQPTLSAAIAAAKKILPC